jgi:hypothetical protein
MNGKNRRSVTVPEALPSKAAGRILLTVVPCEDVLIEAPEAGCMDLAGLYFRPRYVDLKSASVSDAEMPKRLIPLAERFNRRVKALSAAMVAVAKRNEPEGSYARRRRRRARGRPAEAPEGRRPRLPSTIRPRTVF